MSKIVQAVNALLEKKDQISDVIRNESNYYFFLFNGKYKWSIFYNEGDDNYVLFFFPGPESLRQIADIVGSSVWQTFNEYMLYTTQELGTKEAYSTFRDLYATVKEKILGIDKVLADIIGEGDIPF